MRALRKPLPYCSSLSTLLLAGCPTRSGSSGGRNPGGGGGAGGAGGAQPPNTVSITAPHDYVHKRFRRDCDRHGRTDHDPVRSPPPVRSQTIGTITAPQTSFLWSTTGVGEGTYTVTAQLNTNGHSSPRTPAPSSSTEPRPKWYSRLVPAQEQPTSYWPHRSAVFSEAILPSRSTRMRSPSRRRAVPRCRRPSASARRHDRHHRDHLRQGHLAQSGVRRHLRQNDHRSRRKCTRPARRPGPGTSPPGSSTHPSPCNETPFWPSARTISPSSPTPSAVRGAAICPPLPHVAISDGQAWDDLGAPAQGVAGYADSLRRRSEHPECRLGVRNLGPLNSSFDLDGNAWVTTTYPPITFQPRPGRTSM